MNVCCPTFGPSSLWIRSVIAHVVVLTSQCLFLALTLVHEESTGFSFCPLFRMSRLCMPLVGPLKDMNAKNSG